MTVRLLNNPYYSQNLLHNTEISILVQNTVLKKHCKIQQITQQVLTITHSQKHVSACILTELILFNQITASLQSPKSVVVPPELG